MFTRSLLLHFVLAAGLTALGLGCSSESDPPAPGGGPADLGIEGDCLPQPDEGTPDLGRLDAGPRDQGPTAEDSGAAPQDQGTPAEDQGPADLGSADLGPSDQGPADLGPADLGPADLGPADLGPADQGPADQGPSDQGPADQGPADLGPADQGPADLGPPDLGPADLGFPWQGYDWEPEGTCGMPPYRWLPPDAVGAVTRWQEDPGFRLSAEMIEMLLSGAGYPGLIVPHNGTRLFLIHYTTQDQGVERVATGAVAIPDLDLAPGELADLPTVLVMHPTVGYADRCAPSRGLEGKAAALLPASQGYIGVAPDLLGLCAVDGACTEQPHPYLIAEPTAIAALDAVRAAHTALSTHADELGVVPDGRIAPWGPSQGGHGALFVDRYAPHYAPELDLIATVAVVPPADLAGAAGQALSRFGGPTQLGTAFLAAAYLWYGSERPAADLFRADGPRNYAEYIPATYPTTCSARQLLDGAHSVEDAYAAEFLAALAEGGFDAIWPFGCWVQENSLPTSSVPRQSNQPILFIQGEQDELVVPPAQREGVRRMCEEGYPIQFVECSGLRHTDAALGSVALQLGWMAARFAGEALPAESLCVLGEAEACE